MNDYRLSRMLRLASVRLSFTAPGITTFVAVCLLLVGLGASQASLPDKDLSCPSFAVGGCYTCYSIFVNGQKQREWLCYKNCNGDDVAVNSCAGCYKEDFKGMPRWLVSQPDITLWLNDQPFFYPTSLGQLGFLLSYKNSQGTQVSAENGIVGLFSLGLRCHSSWRSYVEAIPTESSNYWVYLGNGTAIKYTLDQVSSTTLAKLTQVSTTNVLQFPDGSERVFGLSTTIGGVTRCFQTAQKDPQGNATRFEYTVGSGTVKLDRVIDVDNKATTLQYVRAGNYSNVISQVTGPYGNVCSMSYDSSGRLTNIVDVAGLSSSMQYDASNLTALVTPYGTNKFTYFSVSGLMTAVKVTEQELRNHLFLYYDSVDGGKVPSDCSSYLPSTTNSTYYALTNTFDSQNGHLRNSFQWEPRAYELLSDNVRTNLALGSFNVSNLTSSDYLKSRMMHWLKAYGSTTTSSTLSWARDTSPDGTVTGQFDWFDYVGKEGGAVDKEGTMPKARFIAKKLPGGESWFSYHDRNLLGRTTNHVTTYTATGNNCRLRTNQFVFAANNIDLIKQFQLLPTSTKQVVSNAFNANHQIITNFDALGQTNVYLYGSNNRLVSYKNAAGLTVTNIYESSGAFSNFLRQVTEVEVSRSSTYSYSNGFKFSETNSRGLSMTHSWDALGRRTQTDYSDGTKTKTVYDKLDPVSQLDRLGFTNKYAFDGFRQRVIHINPRGHTNQWSYCNCGSLDSQIDPMGKTTSHTYDLLGRRLTSKPQGAGALTNVYDLNGKLIYQTDASGVSITNCYNNQGMLCIVSNSVGIVKCTTFDIEDHASEVVDANGVVTTFTYDDLGRKRTAVDSYGKVSGSLYSSLGLNIQTNQLGKLTQYAYDSAGRKTSETNANGEVINYTYNAAGDLIRLVDGKSQSTSWGYDQFGRVTSKTNAAGVEILRYQYDVNGQLTNRWSLAKGATTYAYDAVGNLTNVAYASGTVLRFAYDANGRVTNMTDSVGTTTYTYSDFGQLLSEDGPWSNDTVTYSYATNMLRSGLKLQQPYSQDWSQTYAYDSAGRLFSLSSPAGAFGYIYDSDRHMNPCLVTLGNGSVISNTFDALNRLTGTYLKTSAGSVINSHAYGLDDAGRRIRQTRTDGGYADYEYDPSGQLITARGKELGGVTNRLFEQFGYSYDAAGNLARRTNNALVQTLSVDSLNQLTSGSRAGTLTVAGNTTASATSATVKDNSNTAVSAVLYNDGTFARAGITPLNGANTFVAAATDASGRSSSQSITVDLPSSQTFTYDGNGNLLADGKRSFVYDDENQLTQVYETNKWRSDFVYDGKMRRRISRDYQWVSASWVMTNECRYVYDGNLAIQERDSDNRPQVTYTRGRDLSGSLQGAGGIGGLLARTDAADSTHLFYHADGNGNVTALESSQERISGKYLYDPFGNTLAISGSAAEVNRYRFSSKESHANSGLIYYLYRFYDPNLQRWPNRDPLEESDGPNLFSFVLGNPLSGFDPWGLETLEPSSCEQTCQAARNDSDMMSDAAAGSVVCDGNGNVCPCVLKLGPGLELGECPDVDRIVKNHERGHIRLGNFRCDPTKKCPHYATDPRSKEEHRQEECQLKKQDIALLRAAARNARGLCKGKIQSFLSSVEFRYDDLCKGKH